MTKEEIIDVIHKTMYQFFDVCGDNEEVPMSDKDELLLSVNKAICNNIKTLEQEACEDTISKQDVIKAVDLHTFDTDNGLCLDDDISCILEDLLPVKLTRKQGKWIDDEFGSRCSCCGIHTHLDKFDRPMKFKYCSMCGAEMESEQLLSYADQDTMKPAT